MRFFTPARFVKLQEVSDEVSFEAAREEWERAIQAYQGHLQEVRPELPASVKKLLAAGSLHDSRVLGMWRLQTRLTIALRPEAADSSLLVLTYSLAEEPHVNPAALPEPYRSPEAAWLYDEFGLNRAGATFTHDILLANGWEVGLRFHRLSVSRPSALLPLPAGMITQASELIPRSA